MLEFIATFALVYVVFATAVDRAGAAKVSVCAYECVFVSVFLCAFVYLCAYWRLPLTVLALPSCVCVCTFVRVRFVCVYLLMCVCVFIRVGVFATTVDCASAAKVVCMRMCGLCVCAHLRVSVRVLVCVYIYVCVYVCVCVYVLLPVYA